jgi:hypothetical protein
MGQGFQDAGVNLQAKNFRRYLDQLEKIDKEQQEVFGVQNKGLERSFSRAEKSAKNYDSQLRKTEKTQRSFGKTLGTLGAGAAVGLALREFINFSKESIDLAREQARVEAQLATAIQSTGFW